MAPNYNAVGANQGASPYGSGDPYYNESSGFITPHPAKKRTSNWIKIGVPVLILVIIGAVVGGVLGSRSHKSSNNNNGGSSGSSGSQSGESAASSAVSVKLDVGRFATATNSAYMMPIYPSTVSTLSLRFSFLVEHFIRQIPQHSHPPHFCLLIMSPCPGQKTLSSQRTPVFSPPDLIALFSLRPLTNGKRYLG